MSTPRNDPRSIGFLTWIPNRLVSEEEDNSNETMEKGVEGGNQVAWVDGDDKPPYDLRYNGEGKKKCCMKWGHAENGFEANNHNISKVRSKICNTIVQ